MCSPFDRLQNLFFSCRFADILLRSIRIDDNLVSSHCQDSSPTLFIQDARVGSIGIKVGLISTYDPVAMVLAAILNARITADDAEFELQFEIAEFPVLPDQKSIPLGGILCGCLTGDRSIFNSPEIRVPIPSLERFSIED